jgi:stage III sporulation protein AA
MDNPGVSIMKNMKILRFLPYRIRGIIDEFNKCNNEEILEIRLRVKQAIEIVSFNKSFFLDFAGQRMEIPEQGYKVTEDDLKQAMLILSNNSLYAIERQLIEGFITIPGGHRVGFTGKVILEKGKIKAIKDINSINYRLSREVIGIADRVIDKIYNYKYENLYNTLIISPPFSGKTTLLRDIVRLISQGSHELGIKGKKIGLIDERSEIAGAYNGVAQNNIGSRTDLLDNCPKAEGIIILIRAMSPEVIAVDEIGKKEDVRAIEEAIKSGVSLIATVHGINLNTIKLRPSLHKLFQSDVFQRYIILSNRQGIGTVEGILNENGKEVS